MAFHLDRFIIPCVLDDTPVPEFLRNTAFLDIRLNEADALNRLRNAIREAPDTPNKLPPVVRSQSQELGKIIAAINSGQMRELELIGKGEFQVGVQRAFLGRRARIAAVVVRGDLVTAAVEQSKV